MVHAFLAATQQLFDRSFRRIFWLGLLASLALLVTLAALASWGLASLAPANWSGVDLIFATLGALAGLGLGWLLFPSLTASVIALMSEPIARAVETKHYPDAPPPRPQSSSEALGSVLRLAAIAVAVNLLALPAYLFLPALNLVIYLIFNGYIVALEYFETAASRRFEPNERRRLWRSQRGSLWLFGAGLAFLLTLPVVNLLVPMIAIAAMVHIVERMRHRQR